ncbi:MAG: hypothetical protein CEN91_332 [Candidatus Berkelbacteria bacterium Licking1014_85]|uniref:Uncharacterized protein n=1 Tax=Candidatus Berkelbacteria bacterium Licking1014_85 TaxID=2017148 RepID=A0A554LJA6_9BACT|nr:MAG: hypothetical protein CEN91_332 [Candidatus Berkelbacteria bacterium Licking1014_85]
MQQPDLRLGSNFYENTPTQNVSLMNINPNFCLKYNLTSNILPPLQTNPQYSIPPQNRRDAPLATVQYQNTMFDINYLNQHLTTLKPVFEKVIFREYLSAVNHQQAGYLFSQVKLIIIAKKPSRQRSFSMLFCKSRIYHLYRCTSYFIRFCVICMLLE